MPFPDFEPCMPVFWRETLARHADRTFAVLDEDRITYGEADVRSARLALALAESGAGKGTRVGLLFPNGPEWLVAWLATLRIGAVAVPVNTFQPPRELGWMLRHGDVDTLLTTDSLLGRDLLERIEAAAPSLAKCEARARLVAPELPHLRRVVVFGESTRPWATPADDFTARGDALPDGLLTELEAEVRPGDWLAILYSSGSTSEPKGAIHTHGTMIRHSFNVNTRRDLVPGDVIYSPMPWFWVGGMGFVLLSAMHLGGTLVCEERFEPAATLARLERERATVVQGWPHFSKALSEHPSFPERDLSCVRTGNLLSLLPESQRRHPERRANSLGMTETCGPHTFEPTDVELPPELYGSFGRPLEGVEHRVVSPITGEPLPPGEPGELSVRGYSLMQGLYKREREEVFTPDGFYRTGDGGVFRDGHLFFQGRLGDLIKTAGANVTPREVEVVLEALDEVREAHVVGVPHADRGENVAAAVVPSPGHSPDPAELRARLRSELSAYKVPRHWWIAAPGELPMTDSGKLDKRRLRATLEERIASGEID